MNYDSFNINAQCSQLKVTTNAFVKSKVGLWGYYINCSDCSLYRYSPWDVVQLYYHIPLQRGIVYRNRLVSDSLPSALNWFIHYVLWGTIILHLKVNIFIMNNRWFIFIFCWISKECIGLITGKTLWGRWVFITKNYNFPLRVFLGVISKL